MDCVEGLKVGIFCVTWLGLLVPLFNIVENCLSVNKVGKLCLNGKKFQSLFRHETQLFGQYVLISIIFHGFEMFEVFALSAVMDLGLPLVRGVARVLVGGRVLGVARLPVEADLGQEASLLVGDGVGDGHGAPVRQQHRVAALGGVARPLLPGLGLSLRDRVVVGILAGRAVIRGVGGLRGGVARLR